MEYISHKYPDSIYNCMRKKTLSKTSGQINHSKDIINSENV
jgi:hypothetical protein